MKNILTLTILILFTATTSRAQVAGGRITIGDLRVEDRGETVEISYTARIASDAASRNHTLVFVPVITGAGYRQSLSPVVVHGRGSKTARLRREWVAGARAEYDGARYASNGQTVSVSESVPMQTWMLDAGLLFESVEGGCCSYGKLDDALYAENILTRPEPEPVAAEPESVVAEPAPEWVPVTIADSLSTAFTFVVPMSEYDEDEPFKIYDDERENSLIVFFRVAKHDIDPGYMDNAYTLTNLTATINMIMASADSRVERIVVAGFASPEGRFEQNDRLAFERAVSVKRHIIETTGMADRNVVVYNGSADWRGLRAMVSRSDLPEKEQIISIIDNTPVWDSQRQVGRLGELMRFNGGRTYRYLLDEYFPLLRNGAFIKVYYANE